ncbi:unnamed protein product [Euphydryas editha]|uniref:Tc1-like transposase DDE domain-containing protein n=2 Tax=Euphydryas editha TaxID=104508 RepID=A0AAU9USH6_EUPED|nr:unnamed protein product [Euphydryas editha]
MEPQPSSSKGTPTYFNSPKKKRPKSCFSVIEKNMVTNAYKYIKEAWSSNMYPYKKDMVKTTADMLGISVPSVYRIIKDYKENSQITPPIIEKNRPTFSDKIDDFTKSAIRRKVHSFFIKGELPTLKKVLNDINEDDTLPNFKRTTFYKILKHLKFKYIKRQSNHAIIDSDDIVLWRRNYLYKMKDFRKENRRIFYMDETWVNSGHTVNKTWVDPTVKSKRQAFLDGLSTGAKNPTSKGRRLCVVHIGNEDGFVEGASWIFESKSSGDYHESMDALNFEKWFEEVLPKLGDNAVVVMDNVPYHSRQQEKIPNSNWLKANIQEWLKNKNISFTDNEIKLELLRKVNEVKFLYKKYAVNELAKQHGIEILRLPPYHCELNPIALIWADVKGYVAKNNTTFKFERVKELLNEGIKQITPEKWRKCVEHVKKEEEKFSQLDHIVDNVTDKTLIINVTDSNSESTDTVNSDLE